MSVRSAVIRVTSILTLFMRVVVSITMVPPSAIRAVTWRMNRGIPGIRGVVGLMMRVIVGIRAVVGLMTEGFLGLDGLMSDMPVVERRFLAAASAMDPLMPGPCAFRRNMPRLIPRLARRTAWTTASLVEPCY